MWHCKKLRGEKKHQYQISTPKPKHIWFCFSLEWMGAADEGILSDYQQCWWLILLESTCIHRVLLLIHYLIHAPGVSGTYWQMLLTCDNLRFMLSPLEEVSLSLCVSSRYLHMITFNCCSTFNCPYTPSEQHFPLTDDREWAEGSCSLFNRE